MVPLGAGLKGFILIPKAEMINWMAEEGLGLFFI